MAKVTTKFPLNDITGILGHHDRTIGKDGGLSCNLKKGHSPSILGVKTQATRTRSPGQIAQSANYCICDEEWKKIPLAKHPYLGVYRLHIMKKSLMHMTNYLCWMGLCLSKAWDNNLFLENSYIARYSVKNTSGAPWTSQKVSLKNLKINRPDGTDITVIQTTFHRLPIIYLPHKIYTPGKVIVCIPDMAANETIYIDVYSYGNYSNAQTCV